MLLHFVCSKLINCQRVVSEVEIFLQHFLELLLYLYSHK